MTATLAAELARIVSIIVQRVGDDDDKYDERSRTVRMFRSVVERRLGVEYIGCGSFRAVFRKDGHAYKVALNREGIECNIREDWIWKEAHNAIRPHLVPVIELVSDVLIMEFAEEGSCEEMEDWRKAGQIAKETRHTVGTELEFMLSEKGDFCVDLHEGNITTEHRVMDYAGARSMFW